VLDFLARGPVAMTARRPAPRRVIPLPPLPESRCPILAFVCGRGREVGVMDPHWSLSWPVMPRLVVAVAPFAPPSLAQPTAVVRLEAHRTPDL